ncbi:hypothetical protein M8C21_028424, partial [Ambrosia artemisiifolia]
HLVLIKVILYFIFANHAFFLRYFDPNHRKQSCFYGLGFAYLLLTVAAFKEEEDILCCY